MTDAATNGSVRGRTRKRAEPRLPELGPHPLGMLAIAILALAWVTAFMPEPQVLGTIPGVVGVLLIVERSRKWIHAIGWLTLFGAIGIGFGYRWLAPTVQRFGGLSEPTSWLVTALFGLVGTIHLWIFAFFHRGMLARGRRPHPVVTVALLVAVESLPVRFFPWMAGHGAIDAVPLAQAAEWGGVAGVSFALLCLVVPIHELLRWIVPGRWGPARPGAALVTLLVGAALYAFGWMRAAEESLHPPGAPTLRVAIVQPDIGAFRKRSATNGDATARLDSIAAYHRGSKEAADDGAELVVWPETAIVDAVPMFEGARASAQQTNRFLAGRQYGFLEELGRDRAFLVGLYEARPRSRTSLATGRAVDTRYNVAALRAPGGEDAPWQKVRKVHLIPFGETMPFGMMEDRLPQGFKMLPGDPSQEPLEFRGLTIVPFLCYEGILADYVREMAEGHPPELLASLTNDSWFGDTWEPHQHLNFTRFRAIEHRTPLVRATNTGISAFVDRTGAVLDRLGVGESGVLIRDVPVMKRGSTVYARFGHHLPAALGIFALLAWITALMRPPPLAERTDA